MDKMPINEVLAANLKYFMQEKGLRRTALASKSGIAERTITNYLNPQLRAEPSKSGKMPSAKLTEVERLAEAIGVEVWELLRPLNPRERAFYAQVEASFKKLQQIAVTDTAAAKSSAEHGKAHADHEH